MTPTKIQCEFADFLKEFFKGKDYDKDILLGIFLLCREDKQIDELMECCKKNPNAGDSEVLEMALDICGVLREPMEFEIVDDE